MHPDNFQGVRTPSVGDLVIFHDSRGVAHNTLVTVIYSPSCINGVYVSGDESRQDLYGRQIERAQGRIAKIGPGATRSFDLEYRILPSAADVRAAQAGIDAIQAGREVRLNETPMAKE